MCPTHCRRCWLYLGAGFLAAFGVLEKRGWSNRCHRTLSREIASLGPAAVWSFAIAGPLFTWHLITLPELEA